VRVLSAPGAALEKTPVLEPPAVKVTVEGAQILVSRLKASDLVVYIDMLDLVPTEKDAFSLRCRALAPEGIKVIRIEPPTVRWLRR
ncbi:MAG: hypothetical protein N3A66_08865, partial [Planctomycetota bacterium]|nr:hypothetical protein [Planctomycetota bacterium]